MFSIKRSSLFKSLYKVNEHHLAIDGTVHKRALHASQNCLGDDSSLPVRGTAPSSVMSSVCSNCAVLLPSAVAAVHLSGHITLFAETFKQ